MEYRVDGLPLQVAQVRPQTETQTQEEEPNPILPEPDELIFGTLAFLIVFVALARYAFPRLNQGLRDRREKIRGDLERAEKAREEAEAALQRYEQRLQEARAESGRIIEEGRKTAEQMRRDLLAKAEDESRQVVAKAQEEIRAERDRAIQELRGQLAEWSVELAGRVVGESLDEQRHLKLVEDYIEELTGTTGTGAKTRRRKSTGGRKRQGGS
jgi:F-type H+-transporting ATPase subunit b